MNIKKINEALNGIKKSLKEDDQFIATVQKKLPKIAKVVSQESDIYNEMDAIDEVVFPSGKKVYRVYTPGHSFYFDEKGYIGEEDGGIDDKEINQELANYSLVGKACKVKKIL